MTEFDDSDIFEDEDSLGSQLKEAREAQNLSIQELHEITKIKVDHLIAMEEDRFEGIAAPVYAKGFLKICAETLNLNAQSLIDQYNELYLETDDDRRKQNKAIVAEKKKHLSGIKRRYRIILSSLLIIGALVLITRTFLSHSEKEGQQKIASESLEQINQD